MGFHAIDQEEYKTLLLTTLLQLHISQSVGPQKLKIVTPPDFVLSAFYRTDHRDDEASREPEQHD